MVAVIRVACERGVNVRFFFAFTCTTVFNVSALPRLHQKCFFKGGQLYIENGKIVREKGHYELIIYRCHNDDPYINVLNIYDQFEYKIPLSRYLIL